MKSLPQHMFLALAAVVVMAGLSLMIGAADMNLRAVLSGQGDDTLILLSSRVPRTLAIILTGSSMAIAGLIFQMLTRNKFVEPATAGTAESAGLGLLIAVFFFPAAPLLLKMVIASLCAIAGTMLFLRLLDRLPPHEPLLVPLVGLMLGGVIGAVATFFAYQADLIQYIGIWTTGEFSGVLRGRYEILWLTGGLAVIGYLYADRFSILGMGRDVSITLGLNHRGVMWLGLLIVSEITAEVAAMMVFSTGLFLWLFTTRSRDLHLLVLVGIIFGTLFRSLSGFVARMIDPNDFVVVQDAMFARFNTVNTDLLSISVGLCALTLPVLWVLRHQFDVLALGRETAIGLGLHYRRVMLISFAIIGLLVSVSTALVGPVTFLGLLVTHLAYRLLPGARFGQTLIATVLIAIVTLVGGQAIYEHVLGLQGTLSVVIDLLGGLVFLFLLLKGARR